jgi:hypothetical protein
VVLGYIVWNYDIIVESTWFTDETLEKIFGVTLLLLVLEGVRRALGWLFVGLILAFYLYAYFGGYIPGPLGHRGLSIDRLIYAFYLGENGLLGPLMGDFGDRRHAVPDPRRAAEQQRRRSGVHPDRHAHRRAYPRRRAAWSPCSAAPSWAW